MTESNRERILRKYLYLGMSFAQSSSSKQIEVLQKSPQFFAESISQMMSSNSYRGQRKRAFGKICLCENISTRGLRASPVSSITRVHSIKTKVSKEWRADWQSKGL